MRYSVKLTRQPRRDLAVVKFHATASEIGPKIGKAFGEVAEYLGKHGIPCTGPAVAHYRMVDDGFDVAAGFVVSRAIEAGGAVLPFELPKCDAATTMHVGPYDKLPDAYAAVQKWISARHRKSADGMWEMYLDPPTVEPSKMRTEIFWPLTGIRTLRKALSKRT